jgi:hypothetical protein
LKEWFNNHARIDGSSSGERSKVIDLNIKPKKMLPEWQTYSVLYYEEKLKDCIKSDWESEYLEKNPDNDPETQIPSVPMVYRNERTRAYFEEETDEVKDRVRETRNAGKQSSVAQTPTPDSLGNDEEKRVETLINYQR